MPIFAETLEAITPSRRVNRSRLICVLDPGDDIPTALRTCGTHSLQHSQPTALTACSTLAYSTQTSTQNQHQHSQPAQPAPATLKLYHLTNQVAAITNSHHCHKYCVRACSIRGFVASICCLRRLTIILEPEDSVTSPDLLSHTIKSQ